MTDLTKLTWTTDLTEQMGKVIKKIGDLVDALKGVPNIERTITVTERRKVDSGGGGGTGVSNEGPKPGDPNPNGSGVWHDEVDDRGEHYYKYGSGGLVNFGAGAWARLHGEEAVLTKPQYDDYATLRAMARFSAPSIGSMGAGLSTPSVVQAPRTSTDAASGRGSSQPIVFRAEINKRVLAEFKGDIERAGM